MSNDDKDPQTESCNSRRPFSPEGKINVLRQQLLEKVPISKICEQYQITPAEFYQWQQFLFENGVTAFARAATSHAASRNEQQITSLEDNPKRKDEAIAEVMVQHVLLKKKLGEGVLLPSECPHCGARLRYFC